MQCWLCHLFRISSPELDMYPPYTWCPPLHPLIATWVGFVVVWHCSTPVTPILPSVMALSLEQLPPPGLIMMRWSKKCKILIVWVALRLFNPDQGSWSVVTYPPALTRCASLTSATRIAWGVGGASVGRGRVEGATTALPNLHPLYASRQSLFRISYKPYLTIECVVILYYPT